MGALTTWACGRARSSASTWRRARRTRAAAISTSTSSICPNDGADEPVIVGPISMLGDSIPVAAGHRDGRADARAQASRRDGLDRRRRHQHRRVPRGPELRRRAEDPARRRRRGQQVRLLDADREADGDHAHRRARGGLRHPARAGGRQRHARGVRRREADGRPRPRRRRRDADRRRHDAHAGPRAARRRALRAEGAARRVGGEGSARALPHGAGRRGRPRPRRTSTTSTR